MTNAARPEISVAIATRNYGRYLPRALDSVFRCHNPTSAPIQVVVADDASTDNTRAILAEYRQRYRQGLEVVSIRTSAGAGAAKNAALDRCLGRTVALLDADDEFLPEKLARCHAALSRGGVDIVTHDFQEVEAGQVTLRSRRTWPYYFPPTTWAFRNGVVRFNPLFFGLEDLEWTERRWSHLRHHHLDHTLSVRHVHGEQLSKIWDAAIPMYQLINWMVGRSHSHDRLAPSVWTCRTCGTQYLLAARCCGRDASPRPLLFYQPALSPHARSQTRFSLVMLTRNGLHLTRRAVESFLARLPVNRCHQVEWIFVDGHSNDGTLEYLRQLAQTLPLKLILTHPEEPFNYARACNRAVRAAVGEYVLLLHNDIELEGEEPWEALEAALADPRVGVVGASTVWSAAQRDPTWGDGAPLYRAVGRPLRGAFWGARREVYCELGGLDDALAGYGYEELDFQYRAQKANYFLALARVGVRHEEHGTLGGIYGGAALQRRAAQNRQAFAEKHGEGVSTRGSQVEPFASRGWATESVVIAAEEAEGLRETLEQVEQEEGCRAGRVQVVVVEYEAAGETAVVLEEFRQRLGRCLTVVRMEGGADRVRAERLGQERAIGARVRVVAPGEWAAVGERHPGRGVSSWSETRGRACHR